ncbi:MAG TPA: hypothetical protein VD766_03260 [Solirubrobacterales bacterium]|nr:hypothetical protein [Solirubrobacterales bacterium]
MKLPQLGKRSPKPPSSSGGIKPPAFVSDLTKDMRDRRLIIPAVALLIAIFAVPMLLASDPEPVLPAAPAAVDPDAAALEPGVLAVQEVGVRDFRKRLDSLARKNPFGDRFATEEPKPDEGTELAPPADSGASTGGTATPSTTDPGSSTSPTTPTTPTEPQESFVLVPRVNVEVGIVGRDQVDVIENVKSGTVLPGKKAPAALFLGNTDDSEFAEFLISRDVTQVRGDGNCRPGQNKCEFLRLADSEKALLRYGEDGKRYSLRVTNIFFVRVSESELNEQE